MPLKAASAHLEGNLASVVQRTYRLIWLGSIFGHCGQNPDLVPTRSTPDQSLAFLAGAGCVFGQLPAGRARLRNSNDGRFYKNAAVSPRHQ